MRYTMFYGVRLRAAARSETAVCSARAPLLNRHIRPVEWAAAEQHVSDERLDRRLADEAHEEQLLDHLRRDGAQRRQPQKQLAEARGLTGILRPDVLFQRALWLLLDRLHVSDVRDTAGVWNAQLMRIHYKMLSYRRQTNSPRSRPKISTKFWKDPGLNGTGNTLLDFGSELDSDRDLDPIQIDAFFIDAFWHHSRLPTFTYVVPNFWVWQQ